MYRKNILHFFFIFFSIISLYSHAIIATEVLAIKILGKGHFEYKCNIMREYLLKNNVSGLKEILNPDETVLAWFYRKGYSFKEGRSIFREAVLKNAFWAQNLINWNCLDALDYLLDQKEYTDDQTNLANHILVLNEVVAFLCWSDYSNNRCPKKLLHILEKLLIHTKNPNQISKERGLCSFHHAIWKQHEEAVTLFTKHGQTINWDLKTQAANTSQLQIAPENCTALDLARKKFHEINITFEQQQKAQRILDLVFHATMKSMLKKVPLYTKTNLKKFFDVIITTHKT